MKKISVSFVQDELLQETYEFAFYGNTLEVSESLTSEWLYTVIRLSLL